MHELIEGELSPAEASAVRHHVKSCDECRRFHDELKQITDLFKHVSAVNIEEYDTLLLRRRALQRFLEMREMAPEEPAGGRDFGRGAVVREERSSMLWIYGGMAAVLLLLGFACGMAISLSLRANTQAEALPAKTEMAKTSSDLPERRQIEANPLSIQSHAATAEKIIVVDRVMPSGTRVIWNFVTENDVGS